MRHLNVLSVLVMLLSATTAFSDSIYSNTILTGVASGWCNGCILVDDVLVPSSRDPSNLPIAIDAITIGTLGIPVETELSIYSFLVNSDGTPAPNPVLIDTTFAMLTGQVQQITFGDSSTTLFTVQPNFTVQPGFGLFYIGLMATADWMWANGPDTNLPTAYLYHLDSGQTFLNTSPVGYPPISYYLKVDGTPVPEPASIFLLGTAIFALGCITWPLVRKRWCD